MRKVRNFFLLLSGFLWLQNLSGQDDIQTENIYPAGIYAEYSLGSMAVKDQYISKEKYTGPISQYRFGWAREHEKYIYRLRFGYGFSDQIKNNNARTRITQVFLNQGFLYPLKPVQLFHNDLHLLLGPSIDFMYFFNEPNIAVAGFDYSQSFAAMLSVGLNTDVVYPITQKFQIESFLSLSVLSFTFRAIDSDEDDASPAKLLTLFKGLNGTFNFGARYFIVNNLSLRVGYEFQLLTISPWDPITAASDHLVFGLTYRF
jgi:hypothetical protein